MSTNLLTGYKQYRRYRTSGNNWLQKVSAF